MKLGKGFKGMSEKLMARRKRGRPAPSPQVSSSQAGGGMVSAEPTRRKTKRRYGGRAGLMRRGRR